jgi:ribosomal-protein-alanine N-acetyltransferase
MFPVLETPRIVLRELVSSDAQALFAFRSDAEEQRHNDPPHTSMAESAALIERLAAVRRETGATQWGLTLKGDDLVVGMLGFNWWNREHHRASIGYDLSRALWGHGLMGEAVQAVLDHGFDVMGLNRIEAHTNDDNRSSIRMLRKLGFVREGTFHDQFFEDGRYHDVALFVMLRRNRPRAAGPSA